MNLPTMSAAQDASNDTLISVENPWARASIGMSRPGGAYLTIRNDGKDTVSLVGLRAEISGMASVHETRTNSDGVSSMTPAEDIAIPAGGTVALEPGGYHAMLMQLQSPLVEGETFPLTLLFSDGTELEVNVPILGVGARGPEG
ncbi:copper chaperone PCu(A)C [uncultured Sulfitobacter sp.]|uniref:copper chaperone PCu(A)C n=1 Tax=uncultured Sulfitobacter sp. TaxID=191468 RepID=UPI002603232E|nr:copper chaperone PCu(A)C [uncultured Sulfitobacter sp.]